MKSWLRQHRFALRDAFGRVRKTPGSFLFNVLVVAIALALPFAGLTMLFPFPWRGEDGARFALEEFHFLANVPLLPVPFRQEWFVIEHIHRARATSHEQLHDAFCPRRMMQLANENSCRWFGCKGAVFSNQCRKRNATKAAAASPEKLTPR